MSTLTVVLLVAVGWVALGLITAMLLGKVARAQELSTSEIETQLALDNKVQYFRTRKRTARTNRSKAVGSAALAVAAVRR